MLGLGVTGVVSCAFGGVSGTQAIKNPATMLGAGSCEYLSGGGTDELSRQPI